MKKKNIFLSIALLLPIFVFIFLRFFGKNKFDIPVFHQDRVEVSGDCNVIYTVPYRVPEATLQALRSIPDEPSVVIFSNLQIQHKMRLQNEIANKQLNLILAYEQLSEIELKKMSCIFVLPLGMNSVLVDADRRIRGYYQLENRDETDRLLVELKILFNEY